MTYAIQRDALVRTRQDLIVVGVRECQNHYAGLVQQLLTRTEEMEHAAWTRVSIVSVTADNAVAPDGTMTADTVVFDANGDAIYQTVVGTPVTSKSFTGSVWMRVTSGTAILTIGVLNVSYTQGDHTTCNLTTTWQRFWVQFLFSGVPVDDVLFEISRSLTDTATSVQIWGANLHRNPSDKDMIVAFPYVKRVAEVVSTVSVNASRCSAADAGVGSRCFYSRPTCQDVDGFNAGHTWETTARGKGIREFRFCRQDAPLPYHGDNILPYLVGYPLAAQEIDPERSVTLNERATFEFEDDTVSGLWNPVQSAEGGLVNTATGAGTFWRRFAAIYHNWSNPDCYLIRKSGFVETGGTETDYQQRGKYLIQSVLSQDRRIRLVCVDRLKLTRKTIPALIDDTNLVRTGLTAGTLSAVVTNAQDITTPGAGYTVTLELEPDTAQAEMVNVSAIDIDTNTLTWTRGRWGTAAVAHNADVSFREVYQFGTERTAPALAVLGKNPIDIVLELYAYAGLTAAEIDTAGLTNERDTWLLSTVNTATGAEYGPLLRRVLRDQVEVEELLREIREIALLSLWVNESQVVTGRLYAPALPGVTVTEITDASNIIAGSIAVDDDNETRISRVLCAYDLMAGDTPDTPLNFRRVVVVIDIDAEEREFYGEPKVKAILTEWLQDASADTGIWAEDATARYFTDHILARNRHGVRRVRCQLEIKDDDIRLGDFIKVTTSHVQDVHGAALSSIMQVIKKKALGDNRIEVECLDSGLVGRIGFWAPDGLPDYDAATAANREYGYWSGDLGTVGAGNVAGYLWW